MDDDTIISNLESEGKNFSLLRNDHEFYNDEKNIRHPVISVKRRASKKKGENWEIIVNKEVVLVMKGTRFSKAEKEFLREVEGILCVIRAYQQGHTSVVKIKQILEQIILQKRKK